MLIKAILLGLVGIVGVIDSRLIGRQNIGRPLILSTLAGLVLGDVRQGVILGASLELISMGFVAIGAAGPPNMQFGSIIATAFAILSGASTEAALTIAVPVAVIGEFLSVIMRMVIAQFSHVADKAIENGQFKKAIHIHLWWSFGFNALVYFIPIFLTVYFGTDLVTNLVAAIPQVITNGLTVAGNLPRICDAAEFNAVEEDVPVLPSRLPDRRIFRSQPDRCDHVRRDPGIHPG